MRLLSICLISTIAVSTTAVSAAPASDWMPKLSVCYMHSISRDYEGWGGKASLDVFTLPLPNKTTKFVANVDFIAVPQENNLNCGFGFSVTFKTAPLGINMGIGYIPKDFKWNWNVNLLEF